MFRTSLLLLGLVVSIVGEPRAAESCHSITLTGELQSGNHFEKTIGGELVFRLEPERLGPEGEVHGWRISLVSSHEPDHDFIYPVNPPLRFNGLQILGPSYGDDTKASLAHPHEMRFLLDRADYDRISPLLTKALWPYSAPRPDKADDECIGALKALVVDQLKFTVRTYDADPVNGSIRRIKFQAEFTTSGNFEFDPALKPKPAACPLSLTKIRLWRSQLSVPEMRPYLLIVFSLMFSFAGSALAQPPELPPMHQLDDGEKFNIARLPHQEVEQILAQIQETSFDWPDSWASELRARRVSLGDQEGLIVQGTKLLCGGTGNCQTWVFRRLHGRWTALFESQAPVIAGFGFLPNGSKGIRDLVTVTNAGRKRDVYTVFVFDGSRYRERRCYERSAGGKEKPGSITSVPCMPRRDPI